MKNKFRKSISIILLCGIPFYANPRNLSKDNLITSTKITSQTLQSYDGVYSARILEDAIFHSIKQVSGDCLEKKLIDGSSAPAKEFTLRLQAPEVLLEYSGEDKDELIRKYHLMANYAIGITYWVIDGMRKVSKDSQEKIELYGFEKYLESNLFDKIVSLDYAIELHIDREEINKKKLKELAKKTQRQKQILADRNIDNLIGMNPINYESSKNIRARTLWLENSVINDLRILGSSSEFFTYSDLVKSCYTLEQYKQYLANVIVTNDNCFKAIENSIELPLKKIITFPFVKHFVSKETSNADEYVVRLCRNLINMIYRTTFTDKQMKRYADRYGVGSNFKESYEGK